MQKGLEDMQKTKTRECKNTRKTSRTFPERKWNALSSFLRKDDERKTSLGACSAFAPSRNRYHSETVQSMMVLTLEVYGATVTFHNFEDNGWTERGECRSASKAVLVEEKLLKYCRLFQTQSN
ncbi:hypothetical protein TNCV_35641 [Trichonephila clavipes]|nr:hypothetical protein TNCV_35641 [Trichonephila clavipes]